MNNIATRPADCTLTVAQIWTNRTTLSSRDPEFGLWPHVAKIDGTTFNPPMSIEMITARNADFETDTSLGDDEEIGGIDIACWPTGGWMVALSLSTSSGPYTSDNRVTFTWM